MQIVDTATLALLRRKTARASCITDAKYLSLIQHRLFVFNAKSECKGTNKLVNFGEFLREKTEFNERNKAFLTPDPAKEMIVTFFTKPIGESVTP